MVIFLLTRTECNDVNAYLSHYSKHLLDFARKRNIQFTDLKNNANNENNLTSSIKRLNPKLIVFNGHGSKNVIWGHKNNVLIKEGKNEELLMNRIVYARSCDAASSLGKSAVKKELKPLLDI